jgi:hypothetical protein
MMKTIFIPQKAVHFLLKKVSLQLQVPENKATQ